MNYLELIQKYFSPTAQSEAYRFYLIHVTLVTKKALEIGRKLHLSDEELRFIEEASMLHDIGICRVNAPDIGCYGELPYIQHIVEGARILRAEGYPEHAQVAEGHTGVGILAQEVKEKNLPLPEKDYLPANLATEIISWADLFFSKNPVKIWREKTWEQVQQEIGKYGDWHLARLEEYREKFLI